MHTLSRNPTVESLARSRAVSKAQAQSDAGGRGWVDRGARALRSAPAVSRLFRHALRRALSPSTVMQIGEFVATPIGPVLADFILVQDERRIAIVVAPSLHAREALLLVYGGFDALYRISPLDAKNQTLAAVMLLEAAETGLFSGGVARLSGLMSVRSVHAGRTTLTAEGWDGALLATLSRRRINRPGEWASEFEGALDQRIDRRWAS
ncbi:MAG: hypothetical protein ACI80V_002664 [Rhodothermales bacterium]|jgi:hypothetical protein